MTPKAISFFTSEVNTNKISSITSYDPESKLIWYLQQILPIDYDSSHSDIRDILGITNRIPLSIFVNKKPIFRNPPPQTLISHSDGIVDFNNIKYKYAFFSANKPIKPIEMRGVQLRMKDVAIGDPSRFGVNVETRLYQTLSWIYGEIHIIEGLDNDLSIDRNHFNNSKEYNSFELFIRDKLLRKVLNQTEKLAEKNRLDKVISENILIKEEKTVIEDGPRIKSKIEYPDPIINKINDIIDRKKINYQVITKELGINNYQIDNELKQIIINKKILNKNDIIVYKKKEYIIIYDENIYLSSLSNNIVRLNPMIKTLSNNSLYNSIKSIFTIIAIKKHNNPKKEVFEEIEELILNNLLRGELE